MVVACISFIANFFMKAHHLSKEAESAILGVGRNEEDGRQRTGGVEVAPATELRAVRRSSSAGQRTS